MASRKRTAAALGACVVAAAAAQTVHAALTIEMKVRGTGATSVALNNSGPGNFVEFDVFARVSSLDARPDGIQIAEGGFRSTNVGGTGSVRGTLSAQVLSPFTANGTSNGTQADLDADGDLDIGGTDPTSSAGYFVARAPFMVSPGSFMPITAVPDLDPGPDYVVKIGTARLDVSSVSAGTGDTQVNFAPRINEFGALWSEDSDDGTFNPLPGGTGATFTTKDGSNPAQFTFGTPVTINFGDPAQWNLAAGGTWGAAGNWIGGVPDGGAIARLLGKATSSATITLDGSRTISHLVIDNGVASYTVNVGAAGNKLILNNDAGVGTISVLNGSHTINAPVEIARNVDAVISGASVLTLGGGVNVPAGVTLAKSGTGTLANTGGITLGTGSTLSLLSGPLTGSKLTLAGNATVNGAGGTEAKFTGTVAASTRTLTKTGAGTLSAGTIRAATLAINGGTVRVTHPNSTTGVAVIESKLSIAGTPTVPTAALDVGRSGLVIKGADAAAGQANLTQVRNLLLAGRNVAPGGLVDASWDGNGINSSAAKAEFTSRGQEEFSLGYALNGELPLGALASLGGEPLGNNDMVVMFTHLGDADLDGVVGDGDVTLVGAFFDPNATDKHWYHGDFNYNGAVDDSDVTVLGAFFGTGVGDSGPAPSPASLASEFGEDFANAFMAGYNGGMAAVPEPASLSLLGMGAMALLGRRRRSA